jgi:acetylornithine deacetylase
MSSVLDCIRTAIERRTQYATDLLCDLIRINTVAGAEAPAQELLRKEFGKLNGQVHMIPVPESLREDPEYSHADVEPPYEGRCNLLYERPGAGGGRSVILQTHVDVVPAEEWPEAFTPTVRDGAVWGRGAVDCKGQIVVILLALQALEELGIRLAGDVSAQIVIEEEVGGNGALAMIRAGYRADGVVVFEATDLQVHPANRGAIWFRIRTFGKATHMGKKHEGVSALDKMLLVIQKLYEYEKRLVEESKNQPLFERHEAPVQVNLGVIRGGEWPSMVPAEVTLEGGVGFLPNKPMAVIKQEIEEAIRATGDEWLLSHYELSYPKLHNDSYAIPGDHPLPLAMHSAARAAGLPSEIFGWNVSCDARLYNKIGGMPTIVFGAGSLSVGHSNNEHMPIQQMLDAATATALFLVEWCGIA